MPMKDELEAIIAKIAKNAEQAAILRALLGASQQAMPLLMGLAESKTLSALLSALLERVQIDLGAGSFDAADAGQVALKLEGLLVPLRSKAVEYRSRTIGQFYPTITKKARRKVATMIATMIAREYPPDSLDLASATSGLIEAARWALAGVYGVYRDVHRTQYPLGGAMGSTPAAIDGAAELWQHIGAIESLPPAGEKTLAQGDILQAALWLATRIQAITTRCLEELAQEPRMAYGLRIASPPQVFSVMRELAYIASFAMWFGQLIQLRAAEVAAGSLVVIGPREESVPAELAHAGESNISVLPPTRTTEKKSS